jgi:hypothetical protein
LETVASSGIDAGIPRFMSAMTPAIQENCSQFTMAASGAATASHSQDMRNTSQKLWK